MLKKLVLLAGLTLAFAMTVSADYPTPPCYPLCLVSSSVR
jgi:hypothetical protein